MMQVEKERCQKYQKWNWAYLEVCYGQWYRMPQINLEGQGQKLFADLRPEVNHYRYE